MSSMLEAFLLHSTPYKETSIVAELFVQGQGRIGVVAKGAKRPHSPLRSILLPFQPVQVAYSGRAQLHTLTKAEWGGGSLLTEASALLFGFYLNELLIKFLPRDDPVSDLYDQYKKSLSHLSALASKKGNPDEPLRRLEWHLLCAMGYAPDLDRDASNQPIEEGAWYLWKPGQGFTSCSPKESRTVPGGMLREMSQGSFASERWRQSSRMLMRHILAHYLSGGGIKSRSVLYDLRRLSS